MVTLEEEAKDALLLLEAAMWEAFTMSDFLDKIYCWTAVFWLDGADTVTVEQLGQKWAPYSWFALDVTKREKVS